MAPTVSTDFTPGDDQPDPVARLIAFGYYDGALSGVLETIGGQSYRFDFIGEWPTRGDADSVRMFLLHPLPIDSFSRLVALLSPHCRIDGSYSVPSWWHLPDSEKRSLDEEVDAILNSAGLPKWAVTGRFLCQLPLRIRPVISTVRTSDEWAAAFGLPVRPA